MTTAKILFLKRDPKTGESLAQWWSSVIDDPRFDLVLTFARAELMELQPSQENMRGAEIAFVTLHSMCQPEPTANEFPSPGLHHDFNVPKNMPEPPKPKAKK